MNTQPFILATYDKLDLNPAAGATAATPWLDVASIDAHQCMVSYDGDGGSPATAVLTIETSVDGTREVAVSSALAIASTLTPSAPTLQQIDVSSIGQIRVRVSTPEGSTLSGSVRFLLRREGGFDRALLAEKYGGQGVLIAGASTGVASGSPSGGSGALPGSD